MIAVTTIMIIRIGIWFDARHLTYGGPTRVLLNTIFGLYEFAAHQGFQLVLLMNDAGDYNWVMDRTENYVYTMSKCMKNNTVIGPLVINVGDTNMEDPESNIYWKHGQHFVTPSTWCKYWLEQQGFPFLEKERAQGRTLSIWPAGIDTAFFQPKHPVQKTQDFFVYFKSQHYNELQELFVYIFHNYFNLTGTVLTYYHYSPEMLRQAAQQSRFCIMMDRPETQGLAALEILACDCPIFVIDSTVFQTDKYALHGATSVTCWDDRCGFKSSMETFCDDFPGFLEKLETYKPREYVCESYSLEKAAKSLFRLVAGKHHQP